MASKTWRISSAALSVTPHNTDIQIVLVHCVNNATISFADDYLDRYRFSIYLPEDESEDTVAQKYYRSNKANFEKAARKQLNSNFGYVTNEARKWLLSGYTTYLGADGESNAKTDVYEGARLDESLNKWTYRGTIICDVSGDARPEPKDGYWWMGGVNTGIEYIPNLLTHAYGSLYYGVYVRLSPDGTAMLVFSTDEVHNAGRSDKEYVEWNKKSVTINETEVEVNDYNNVKYVWLKLGVLGNSVYADSGYSKRNILDEGLDYGELGTQEGIANAIEEAKGEWNTTDSSTKTVNMNDEWTFGLFRSKMLGLRLWNSDASKLSYQESGAENFLVLGDGDYAGIDTSGLGNTHGSLINNSNNIIPTIGWIMTTLLKWFRSKLFVRKDNSDGTEVMEGSLTINKNIAAGGNATITGVTKSGSLEVTDKSELKGRTVAPDITSSENLGDSGLKSHDETTLGRGVSVYADNNGGHVVTDYMVVRKSAYFRELTIDEVKHIGGELILSQAACQISRVVGWCIEQSGVLTFSASGGSAAASKQVPVFDTSGIMKDNNGNVLPTAEPEGVSINYYRLYFDTKANGKNQYNEWIIGDQVRCQSMGNLSKAGTITDARNSYYWRVVINSHTAVGEETEHYIDVSNITTNLSIGSGYSIAPGCDTGCTIPQPNDSIALLGCRDTSKPSRQAAQVYSTAENNSPSRRYYQGIKSFDTSGCEVEVMEWVPASGDTAAHAHWRVGNDENHIDFSDKGLDIVASSVKMAGSDKSIGDILDEHQNQLGEQIVIHAATVTDPELPTPNNMSAVYETQDADEYTKSIMPLESHVGDYYITVSGLVFTLAATSNALGFIWKIVTDKYLIDAVNTAASAEGKADSALQTLADQASDKVITPSEKILVRQEMQVCDSEYAKYFALYNTYTKDMTNPLDAEWDAYNAAYGVLCTETTGYYKKIVDDMEGNSYFNDYTGSEDKMSFSSIDYVSAIKNYSKAEIDLIKKMTDMAESNAKKYTDTQVSLITNATNDGKLDVGEKRALNREFVRIVQEKNTTLELAVILGLTEAQKSSYSNAFGKLCGALESEGLVEGEDPTSFKDSVYESNTILKNIAKFNSAWEEYYTKYAVIAKLIADAQKKLADDAQSAADTAKEWATMTWEEQLLKLVADSNVTDEENILLSGVRSRLIAEFNSINNAWKEQEVDANGNVNATYNSMHDGVVVRYKVLYTWMGLVIGDISNDDPMRADGLTSTWRKAYLNNYKSARDSFLSAKGNFEFELGRFRNKMSNYFEWDDDDVKVREESGIVTTSEYAEMFSSRTVDGKVDKYAGIKTMIQDNASNIAISADQIDISGNTAIKGIVVREPKFVTPHNKKENIFILTGPEQQGFLDYSLKGNQVPYAQTIPMEKLAANTYLYCSSGENMPAGYGGTLDVDNDWKNDDYKYLHGDIHIFLPRYGSGLLNATNVATGYVTLTENMPYTYESEYYSNVLDFMGGTMSDSFKLLIRESRGERIMKARKYLGTEIQLHYLGLNGSHVYIHGLKTVNDQIKDHTVNVPVTHINTGELDFDDHWVCTSDDYNKTLALSPLMYVTLKCVRDENGDGIHWTADVYKEQYIDKYIMGLPDYVPNSES